MTRLAFDLLQETWDRTNLSAVKPGSAVNLERSLAAGDRLGGHFVTGHIDGTGKIRTWERRGRDHILEITAPAAICRYIVFKGSVAVDGISLTVADVFRGGFRRGRGRSRGIGKGCGAGGFAPFLPGSPRI